MLIQIILILLLQIVDLSNSKLYIYEDANNFNNPCAVLILPGGGYKAVAVEQGKEYAEWLSGLELPSYVLEYRTDPLRAIFPAPYEDANEAFFYVKKMHKMVGILGTSAGGHLAATLSTYNSIIKPDFLILIYPVITLTENYRHIGSRESLFGLNYDPNLVDKYSAEKHITKDMPKTFLVHGWNDKNVPVENSLAFYLGLRRCGVPAELHLYQNATHGFNHKVFGEEGSEVSTWPILCENWLRENKYIGRNK